jgi:hypothetical protein
MPLIKYQDIRIQKRGLALIDQINTIIDDYTAQGYSLTLRQVYYQLVSRDIIENSERSYKNIGELINNGRLAGLIDWQAIEDRTRFIRSLSHWDSPREIIETAARSYHIDLWADQPFYVEVWVEKDALIGVIEQTAQGYDVSCFSCKDCIIIHLGDHDPSGLDMSRDIRKRMAMFGAVVRVDRIALNMPQIKQYNPPPNPAKITDTRATEYIKQYGAESWELDALEPAELDRLIRKQIEIYLDRKKYDRAKRKEERERAKIQKIIDTSLE